MFLVKWVRQFFERPWYLYLCALLAALDIFVLFIPTDGLLITYVWAKPKHWIRSAVIISIGSAVGALILAAAIRYWGEGPVDQWISDQISLDSWHNMTKWIETHGVWALALISGGPFPLQPGAALAALGHMPLSELFLSALFGRLVKYILFAYLSVRMPHLLRRSKIIRHEIEEVQGESSEKRIE